MSKIVQQLLQQRGIGPAEQEVFLHPDFQRDLHDPLLMQGMTQALARIKEAINRQEKIAVFGDYDADGVPATALLMRGFERIGVTVHPYIPTRASGYGLTAEVVELLIKEQFTLLITVDNGTVAKTEIAALKAAGIDTIVCDHHQPVEEQLATEAVAILNPKQPGCPYPFKELCGCAIAWKLLWALYSHLGKNPEQLKWDLDLVALSTIADMVPLLGENRVLAKYGLQVLRKSRNAGLKALAEIAGINLAEVSAGGIGFQLAPRINAPSRMHQEIQDGENVALRLLTTTDQLEAQRLAHYLNRQNSGRQTLLEKHLKEALLLTEKLTEDHCLILYKPTWSSGVIGLMAGRLLERYSRPVIVLAQEGEAIKGSVRSVEGVDAVSLVAAGQKVLERYGGHSKAAGLTFKGSQTTLVEEFRRLVKGWMLEQGLDLIALKEAASAKPDLEVSLADCTLELAEELEQLEPFGIGFPSPLFIAHCRLRNLRRVGKEQQHLSCYLEQDGVQRKAIAFRMGGLPLEEGQACTVYFSLEVEEWNGMRNPSCQIKRIISQS